MKKLSLLLAIWLIGCGETSDVPDPGHPQAAEVGAAIVEMLTHTTDPFLIVEDPETQKFIQFYNDDGTILVDLPEDSLTAAEIEAARSYFEQCDVPLREVADTDPDTGETFVSRTWTKTFPREKKDEVVEIALGALFEIHGITDSTPLTLTKGWE